jgi:membrane-anchored protein YejM (alkaline phosphatase superfamily)
VVYGRTTARRRRRRQVFEVTVRLCLVQFLAYRALHIYARARFAKEISMFTNYSKDHMHGMLGED